MAQRTNYWDYIRVEELIALQGGVEGDDALLSDAELRFVVIHQIDELWFKLVIREFETVRDLFRKAFVPESKLTASVASLRRVAIIFRLAAQHFELMETMPTNAYLEFRDKLSPASGFQSAQHREIEILMGLTEAARIPVGFAADFKAPLLHADGTPSSAHDRVTRREQDLPSLKDALYSWLLRAPIQGSRPEDPGDAAVVATFLDAYLDGHARAHEELLTEARRDGLPEAELAKRAARDAAMREQAAEFLHATTITDPDVAAQTRRLRAALLFVETYRTLPLLAWPAQVIEAMIEVEQATVVFRQRHARMVERVIGRRPGTGGSDGVGYLDDTALAYRVFDELWAVKTLLLRSDFCPPVLDPTYYDFKEN